jgi:hypothetical protein
MASATVLVRHEIPFAFEPAPDARDLVDLGDHHARPRLDDRGRLTLDEVLVGVWEGLRSDLTVACPVCGGALAPHHGHGPRAVGGSCADCGATLS